MISSLLLLEGIIERGSLFSLVVASIFLSSRVIKFDDLSIEGSYGLGGAITAWLLLHGFNPLTTIPIALGAGALAGALTGGLHTYLHMNNLISGIIVTTGLFSVSLNIGSSSSNLMNTPTLFSGVSHPLLILLPLSFFILYGCVKLLKTEVGLVLRTVGQNQLLLATLSKNVNAYKIGCLMLSNAITALCGGLFVHLVGYFSIWANVGVLIIAFTGLVLSELLTIFPQTISFFLGATLYQTLITATLELQIDQSWNKFVTAVFLVTILLANRITQRSPHDSP